MDNVILLAELRALAAAPPDFSTYAPASRPHLEWLAKTDALLSRWSQFEIIPFRSALAYLPIPMLRDAQVSNLLLVLHRAIADLELSISPTHDQAFGPGAVYDFLKALRDVVGSASSSLFIVDPYLDDQIFDAYLSVLSAGVVVRLLTRNYAQSLKPSLQAFLAQTNMTVEVRSAHALHDRVVFVDDRSCWVIGQSLKDAARTKPTYIAPLSPDAAQLKKDAYELIWGGAAPLS